MDDLVISVEKARELLSEEQNKKLSDDEVRKLIFNLDEIAKTALEKSAKEKADKNG